MSKPIHVLCIGAGYVGGPTMSVVANETLGKNVKVTVVDLNKDLIAAWNSDELPVPSVILVFYLSQSFRFF